MKITNTIFAALILSITLSCGTSGEKMKETSVEMNLNESPKPNADSLLAFVQKQVDFGPRVPNTEAHQKAADWFVKKFEGYGGKVVVQEFKDNVYDGTEVSLKNIIVSFNPSVKKRILLAAHWDTRPFGDKEAENDLIPIDGANDGASGVGVLLEVARVISTSMSPTVGVDMILFDGEDWGVHQNSERNYSLPSDLESWYCLGSQYWSKNKHSSNYTAYYGILLDMVGAPDATFYYDNVSQENAGRILTKTWDIAHQLGYQKYFIKEMGLRGIIDDHVFVNKNARIPMIDILDYRTNTNNFGPYHHTSNDNMSGISKETLSAVADVLLTVLYNE